VCVADESACSINIINIAAAAAPGSAVAVPAHAAALAGILTQQQQQQYLLLLQSQSYQSKRTGEVAATPDAHRSNAHDNKLSPDSDGDNSREIGARDPEQTAQYEAFKSGM
jgi:hypothetical protein